MYPENFNSMSYFVLFLIVTHHKTNRNTIAIIPATLNKPPVHTPSMNIFHHSPFHFISYDDERGMEYYHNGSVKNVV